MESPANKACCSTLDFLNVRDIFLDSVRVPYWRAILQNGSYQSFVCSFLDVGGIYS